MDLERKDVKNYLGFSSFRFFIASQNIIIGKVSQNLKTCVNVLIG